MKPTFLHRAVNGPFDDPVIFVRVLRERRAFLFDAGDISRLTPRDLQKITDVFISHTHIDHFIGFDTLVRSLLRRNDPLRVYGPSSLADHVEGKLRAYAWNLIAEYPLQIEVFSVDGGTVHHASFHAPTGFRRRDNPSRQLEAYLIKEPLFAIRTLQLDHQIPCLAYSLEEEFHINIDKAALRKMALPVGPWLADLKRAIRERASDESEIAIERKRYTLSRLRPIVRITRGQKISYVTDVSITEENIRRVIEFVRDSDTLYCEAYFLHEDIERAYARFHLTAKIAGSIAREANVKNLIVMHFSPRYRDRPEAPALEAMEEFTRAHAEK